MQTMLFILQIVQTVIWPAFGVFLVFALKGPLSGLLQKSSLTSVELPGGIKIGLSQQLASAAAVGVAIGKQTDETAQSTESAVQTVAQALSLSAQSGKAAQRQNILWVDDIPDNNTHLAEAFRALGYKITLARSTNEALGELDHSAFDLVISDMGRPPDGEAGLTLLRALRDRGLHLPMIVFAAGWARGHKGEEAKFGLAKITNDTSVVYATVVGYMTGGSLPAI
jgi:CheY-like chemotaxis protein